jgi:hypothetical protein
MPIYLLKFRFPHSQSSQVQQISAWRPTRHVSPGTIMFGQQTTLETQLQWLNPYLKEPSGRSMVSNKIVLLQRLAIQYAFLNTCEVISMSLNDTCWTVSSNYKISYPAFLNYPTINTDCSNLPPSGSVVCVTSPDGTHTPGFFPSANKTSIGVFAE